MDAKTFYIETFGCQMNVHDSEKVIGTLMAQGYAQVPTPEEAHLVLYNTCSIRDKAEQKVFSRLSNFKRQAGSGKVFGVLGCVAQHQGERIFEQAPHVGLVCGSASYNKLPQLLVQLETGNRRVTGLSLDTDETFDTPFTKRDNPFRAYLTIIEGCDKHCAYCVVPFTRGPERSRTSDSVMAEVRQLAAAGYTEIQLLGQNVNSYRDPSPTGWDFAELLARVAEVPGLRRVRFTTSHPRDFNPRIVAALEANPVLCDHVHLPVQSGSDRVLAGMRREYTRSQYMERIAWMKQALRPLSITTDIIVGFPGETEEDFKQTLALLDEVEYDSIFSFKYSPRPNTAAAVMADAVPEEEKTRRLMILQDKQRSIQVRRNAEQVGTEQEVLVEGRHEALGQWVGRTSQNRVVNFTAPDTAAGLLGRYQRVRISRAGPNSLVGEVVAESAAA
ncbi:MAG TPA: tRNA (N6-isopentenyl adenosine(37)-C2)-methylthiotransferase MiaB [Bryobacterales bacterium]|nr:tRNA (N6-isopentenyl adenosine(37)-C2)-methylthiotransferase MiaB [Bryobacterales bacterium]